MFIRICSDVLERNDITLTALPRHSDRSIPVEQELLTLVRIADEV